MSLCSLPHAMASQAASVLRHPCAVAGSTGIHETSRRSCTYRASSIRHASSLTPSTAFIAKRAVLMQRKVDNLLLRSLGRPSTRKSIVCSVASAETASWTRAEGLTRWLEDNGALTSGAVRVSSNEMGLGLAAARDVKEREVLFSVPQKICLSAASPQLVDRKFAGLVASCRPWIRLALVLLNELRSPSSFWRPYIDSLPTLLDAPLFWSDAELEELKGSQLLDSTSQYREYVQSEYEALQSGLFAQHPGSFPADAFSLELFTWAFGILRSRTFPPLTGENLMLVPLADCINHGEGDASGKAWELQSAALFSKESNVVMVATRAHRKGEPVLLNYGADKSNATLALDFGLVEARGVGTPSRSTFLLTLEIPENDKFRDDKLDILDINGLEESQQFMLIADMGGEPPQLQMPFMRLMNIVGPDAFHLESVFRKEAWAHVSGPLSEANETAVCKSMIIGCRQALSGYATTRVEDEALLAGPLATITGPGDGGSERVAWRRKVAVVVRHGEKLVLEQSLAWYEARLAELDKLQYYAERRLQGLGLIDADGNATYTAFDFL